MVLVLVALAVALVVTLLTTFTEHLLILGVLGVAFGVCALNVLGYAGALPQHLVISMALTFAALALTRLLMRSSSADTVAARLPRRLPPL